MSPELLAKNNTESGHQKALFAWASMAKLYGFEFANNMNVYSMATKDRIGNVQCIPIFELQWLHAIPNGGNRDIVTASRLKAEGVKPGIADIFLPVSRNTIIKNEIISCGLYIELKKIGKNKTSDEQLAFQTHCIAQGYKHVVCEGWRSAADEIEKYMAQ